MEKLKTALGNPVTFLVGYLVFMIATYLLPYGGSNSAMTQGLAAAAGATGIGFLFILHLISLVVLCVLTWIRGSITDRSWIVVFPIIASIFDMVPGLSWIPLVPTAMHVCSLVMGFKSKSSG